MHETKDAFDDMLYDFVVEMVGTVVVLDLSHLVLRIVRANVGTFDAAQCPQNT